MPTNTKSETESFQVYGISAQTHTFHGWNKLASFYFSYVDIPVNQTQETKEKVLDLIAQSLKWAPPSQVLLLERVSLKGYPGRHLRGLGSDNTEYEVKVYSVNRRFYWQIITQAEHVDQESANRFFDSFTFEPR
jgi:hypothetical protein